MLQGQWENLQKGILVSHHQRNTKYNEQKAALYEDLSNWRTQNNQVQEKLNGTIEDLQFKFNDLSLETQKALDKLDHKLKNAPKVRWC